MPGFLRLSLVHAKEVLYPVGYTVPTIQTQYVNILLVIKISVVTFWLESWKFLKSQLQYREMEPVELTVQLCVHWK